MLRLTDLPQRLREMISHEPETDCWLWYGSRDDDGLPLAIHWGKRWSATWLFWTLANGTVPTSQEVDPCNNPQCVNPVHLKLVAAVPLTSSKKTLTVEQVLELRKVYASGKVSLTELGQQLGRSPKAVGRLMDGKHWRGILPPAEEEAG